MLLEGKVAMITGGLGCLGSVVGRTFRCLGARVAVVDRALGPLGADDTASIAIGGIDLTDIGEARRAVSSVIQHYGRLDVLVNIAGGFVWQPVGDANPDVWDQMYSVNLKTAVVATMAAIPHLRAAGSGRIVNMGAASAVSPGVGMGAYAAAKAGVHCFTAALAEELRADHITVNAVLPTIIDTPQNRASMPDADFGTWIQPQEIADLIALLASGQANAMTGAAIVVKGRG
ncbi:MAG: SDR family NAD(P)-dependent oxidoreductase [Dehalococcoidia bacterium]